MIAYTDLDIGSLGLAPLYIEGHIHESDQDRSEPSWIQINDVTLICDLSHCCNVLYANGQLFLVSLMHTFYLI